MNANVTKEKMVNDRLEMRQFMRKLEADLFVRTPEGPNEPDYLQTERKRTSRLFSAIKALIESAGEQARPVVEYKLRSEVAAFAALMEAELRKHDDRPGWKGERFSWLLGRLHDEVEELDRAIEDGQQVVHEAADVANFAMMIADVGGGLKASGEQPAPPAVTREEQFGKILFFDCISKPSSAPERNCEQCDHAVECDESCEKIEALISAPPQPAKVSREWVGQFVDNIVAARANLSLKAADDYADKKLRELGIAVEDGEG